MKKNLISYLSKYTTISTELERALTETLMVREYKKGTVLLSEGKECNECYFILKGLIRSYYLKGIDEVTTDFYLEEESASPSCFGKRIPSKVNLQCLEDTIAVIGTPDIEEKMYQKYPELEKLSRIIGDKIISNYSDKLDHFKLSTPEERYLWLIDNRMELIERVPQYLIASYLGIKPESLSRIRKRIS